MPRLDPAVVDLGVHGSNLSEAAVPDHGGGRLLRLPEKGRRRAAEPQPARRRERDQLLCLARAERHRLLAVHVTPRLEGALRHLVMGVVDGQVDDDVDRRIGQQLIERAVDGAAVLGAERRSLRRIQVRRRCQPDLRMREDVGGVGTRDVAGADDAEAERCHDRRGYDSSMPYRGAMRHDQIALQLYTVRQLAADDLAGTLQAVAAAGYRAVELAGLPDTRRASWHGCLATTGLRPVASHEGIERLRDDVNAVADRLARCRVSAGDRSLDAGGGPPHRRRRAPIRGRARRIRRDIRGARNAARLSQPRVRIRASRRHDGVGRPAGRAPDRGRARAGRLLGGCRRSGPRRHSSERPPNASGCCT